MSRRIHSALDLVRRVPRQATAAGLPVAHLAATLGRRLPEPMRSAVSTATLRRPGPIEVDVDLLLQGAQAGLQAAEFAAVIGDLRWGSTPVAQGPHTALLRAAIGAGAPLTDDEILASPYGRMARRMVQAQGRYFDATDDATIVRLARTSITRAVREDPSGGEGAPVFASSAGDPILVAPVAASPYYQVLDGHHRVAAAIVAGHRRVKVTAKWLPVHTPLQLHLERMNDVGGSRELSQPVSAPELAASWTLVHACTDRRDTMLSFLGAQSLLPPATLTYLDVASRYGWFVAAMRDAGFDAHGVERDPLGRELGVSIYALAPGDVRTGTLDDMHTTGAPWDVVSCFGRLHHAALRRGSGAEVELIRRLDAATGRVLFVDAEHDHEALLRGAPAGWDADRLEALLREHTTFDRVVPLTAVDGDAVPTSPHHDVRTLFACVRG